MEEIPEPDEKLLPHRFVGAELRIVFRIDLLDLRCGLISAELFGRDGRNRVAGHEAWQNKVQYDCEDECQKIPEDLLTIIFSKPFQSSPSASGLHPAIRRMKSGFQQRQRKKRCIYR